MASNEGVVSSSRSSSYDSRMLTEDALKKLSSSNAVSSHKDKSVDSKLSEGLMLRPMNSDNYTAAQNGVQSVVSRLTTLSQQDRILSKSLATTIEENKELKVETFGVPEDGGDEDNNGRNDEIPLEIAQKPSQIDEIDHVSKQNPNEISRLPQRLLASDDSRNLSQSHIPQTFEDPHDVSCDGQQNTSHSPQPSEFRSTSRAASRVDPPTNGRPKIEALPSSITSPSHDVTRNKSPMRDPFEYHPKQIKDQRRPLYTPAVLRTNEMALYPSDRAQSDSSLADDESDSRGILRKLYRPKLNHSQSSVWSSAPKLDQSEYIPIRKHWKADSSRFSCSGCGKLFHFLTAKARKHHCRHCGEIFCSNCLRNVVYLNAEAKFVDFVGDEAGSDGTKDHAQKPKIHRMMKRGSSASSSSDVDVGGGRFLSKVCDSCYSKYEAFLNEMQHSTHLGEDLDPQLLGANGALQKPKIDASVNSVGSIPADWNWSSF
ncbi:unnamed protein product [Kuraishia capsulata CBS 1993]|uniref:FYVE-type domain-containing protein n=1 Tax=Kuraishia capsulata CBS 1993 TaxID=1382522 RepID=W6MPC3_9ASCO|nr:uncharacterized protein KUCA_T00004134001 [Kuraishia capsulata CBS 1993]CDK28153.1 unnamed protein product [Kuraishia capsulata CBS 1993]